ncbi:Protein CBG28103 [Caenorhabditis briggsae]|uniref:Protein CBG28103 n=1 Tax=Caenorhabditis briggsae TaxID=6238 RepID=B6IGU2_CAEBR|nr:Protein CBG28103 [Caenorhabditis briggsae]CAR99122.1 Protein CBG28103 [Caenorhabditis briggsae]
MNSCVFLKKNTAVHRVYLIFIFKQILSSIMTFKSQPSSFVPNSEANCHESEKRTNLTVCQLLSVVNKLYSLFLQPRFKIADSAHSSYIFL